MTTGTARPATQPPAPRRRQADRSADTRRRLLDATVVCLARHGYQGATLAMIVAEAGVSRGAQVHHFGSRQQLMLEAAEDLFKQVYKDLGRVLLALPDPGGRLRQTVTGSWAQLFSGDRFLAYQALLTASHQDAALAAALATLLVRVRTQYEPAVDHYFEAAPGAVVKPRTVFVQLACFLHGLAAQAHLAPDPAVLRHQLEAYAALMGSQLRVRRNVTTRPPKPAGDKT